jgi:6-pyruvoyl-tetrahydropterin synthase
MPLLKVKHNIEVAHRLYEMPGKCENIHGHSMWVTLGLEGGINDHGVVYVDEKTKAGLNFGDVKKEFRGYLDDYFDHHVLLNEKDPWAGQLRVMPREITSDDSRMAPEDVHYQRMPGLQAMPGDPTTEHLALWIGEWAAANFQTDVEVEVWETAVNAIVVLVPWSGV